MSNESTSSEESLTSSSHPRQFVYALNSNDVILGRGQHLKHLGNGRLVALVRSNVIKYHTSQEKCGKDNVARQIVQEIHDAGGRFVRKFSAEECTKRRPLPNSAAPVWEIAHLTTVLVKIKQTFRDYSAIQRKAAKAASAAASVDPVSTLVYLDSPAARLPAAPPNPYGFSMARPSYHQFHTVATLGNQQCTQQVPPLGTALSVAGKSMLSFSPRTQPMNIAQSVPPPPATPSQNGQEILYPPAEPVASEMLKQALNTLLQHEHQRQLQQILNEPPRSIPAPSLFTVPTAQPLLATPFAAAANPSPAEVWLSDRPRQAVDTWLCRENQQRMSLPFHQAISGQSMPLLNHAVHAASNMAQPVLFASPSFASVHPNPPTGETSQTDVLGRTIEYLVQNERQRQILQQLRENERQQSMQQSLLQLLVHSNQRTESSHPSPTLHNPAVHLTPNSHNPLLLASPPVQPIPYEALIRASGSVTAPWAGLSQDDSQSTDAEHSPNKETRRSAG